MTVEEVVKQQNQQKMLAALERSKPDMYRKYAKMQREIAENEKAAKDNLVAQGEEYVKNQNRQNKLNQLTNAFKSIWTSMADALEPMIDGLTEVFKVITAIAEWFASWPGWLRGTLGYIIAGFAAWRAWATYKQTKAFIKDLKNVGGAIKDIASATRGAAPAAKELTGTLTNVGRAATDAAGGAGGAKGLGGFTSRISGMGMIQAAASVAIFAGAMWVLAKAFQEFKKVDPDDIAKGIISMAAAITILGVAAGIIEATGLGEALLIVAGSVALLGVGALAAGKGIDFFAQGIQKLQGAKMDGMAGNIAAIAGAFALFGVGGVLGGIGALFGVGVFVFLERLTAYSVDLERVGNAIDKIRKAYFDLTTEMGKKVTINIPTDTIQSLEKMVSGKIQAAVEVIATTAIEVKNLNELKETIQKLVDAISTLGGTAGAASPVVNVNNNQNAMVEKLDELIGLFKNGTLKLSMNGHSTNKAFAGMA